MCSAPVPEGSGEKEVIVMDTDAQDDKFDKLSWWVPISVRYHDRREGFFIRCRVVTMLFVVLPASCIVMSGLLLAGHLVKLLSIFGVVVVALGSFYVMTRFGARAALHNDLRRRFIRIEQQMTGLSEDDTAQIDRLMKEVLAIEADRPRVLNVLNNICYNEEAVVRGRVDAMVPMSFMQRLCADFFDWRPETLVSGAARKPC